MNSWRTEARSNGAFRLFLVLLFMVLQFELVAWAGEQQAPSDKAEAQKWMKMALRHSGCRKAEVTDKAISFANNCTPGANGQLVTIMFARVSSTSIQRDKHASIITWRDFSNGIAPAGGVRIPTYGNADGRFKVALDFLVAEARQQETAQEAVGFEQFQAQAAAWRAMSDKPAMPEEARQHKVLAEYAYQQRDVAKAMREYTAALDLFPCWPEGQFNLALLAGEQKDYATAVLHMKEYVELVPDAPDTQAARDRIIIWQDKLNEATAAPALSPQSQRRK